MTTQQAENRIAVAFDHSDPYLEDFETMEFEASSQKDLDKTVRGYQERGWSLYSVTPHREEPRYDPLHGEIPMFWWDVIMTYPLADD